MANAKNEKIDFKQLSELLYELKTLACTKKVSESYDEDAPNSLAEKFEKLLSVLNKHLETQSLNDSAFTKILTMKAALYYEHAKLWNSLRLEGSEKLVETGIKIIHEKIDEPNVTYMYLKLINYLSCLLLNRREYEQAKNILETTIEKYQSMEEIIFVYNTEELFSGVKLKLDKDKFTKLIIYSYQLLAWLDGKLGLVSKQADRQHVALEKQLVIHWFDPVLWSYSCIHLAHLYLSSNRWNQARYHLQAANEMLCHSERCLMEHPDLTRIQAELAREWVNYSLNLFSLSRTQLIEQKYPDMFKNKSNDTKCEDIETVIPFSDLEIIVSDIPVDPVITIEEARNLFTFAYLWLKRARLYYTLRDYPIHYVNSVLDLSELYRYLAYYENVIDFQYDIHKQRLDALENVCTVLKDVRPQCYLAVNVELFRELAEIQIEMMGLNLKKICSSSTEDEIRERLKRKIAALSDIHTKLLSMGNILKQ